MPDNDHAMRTGYAVQSPRMSLLNRTGNRAEVYFTGPCRGSASHRLLLLSTSMGMGGGAEEQVMHLGRGLKARGWEVMIVSMLPPSPMPPEFEGWGIRLLHLGMRPGMPSVSSLFRLARIIREFRPDVVHSHLVHANLLARVVRIIQPFPVLICTMHSLTMAGVKRDWSPIFAIAHRVTDTLCDETTTICQAATDYCIKKRAVPAAKISTVHNCVEVGAFLPSPDVRQRMRRELGIEDKFVWLAVGRLEPPKAYPILLRAMAALRGGNRILLVCGQGSLQGELAALTEELGIGEKVRFLGLRSDVPAIMSAADGFAMSSDLEGLPLALIQAAAAGLPIVATDVGGNSEVVTDGLNGRLTPARDPVRFAQALADVEAMDHAGRSAFGRAGQLRALEMFDTQLVLKKWMELYAGLLGQTSGVAFFRGTGF